MRIDRLQRQLCSWLKMIVRLAFIFSVAFVSLGDVLASERGRPVTLADLETLSQIPNLDISISPDERFIAADWSGEIRIIDLSRRRVVRALGEGLVPEWSPDGSRLAFYSSRSGELQLWLWDRSTDRLSQLTALEGGVDPNPSTSTFGRVQDAFGFSWSPRGTRIVFASRPVGNDRQLEPADHHSPESDDSSTPLVFSSTSPIERAAEGIWRHAKRGTGIPEARDGRDVTYRSRDDGFGQLYFVDTASHSLVKLTDGRATRFHPAWSPNGDRIAFIEVQGTGLDDPLLTESQLFIFDVRRHSARRLTNDHSIKSFPRWSQDGAQISFVAGPLVVGPNRIQVVSANGPARTTTIEFDRRIRQYRWLGSDIVAIYNDGVSIPLGRLTPHLNDVRRLTDASTTLAVSAMSVSPRGTVAWFQMDPVHLISLKLLRAGVAVPTDILTALDFGVDPQSLALGRVEVVSWTNRSGETKEGTLLLPPGAGSEARFPVIVDAYTTRVGADWSLPLGGNQAWASMGYAVFRPSPRAPHAWTNPWVSDASSAAGKGANGWNVAYDDIMSGLDELIRRGVADPDRICLFGHSNGGNVVTEMVTRTNRFRCAVIVAPAASDMVRLFLLGGWNPSVMNDNKPLEENLSEYIQMSPVYRLHNVSTPVLIAAGDQDGDFLLNALEIYNRLRARGAEVTLLRYPDQGHVFSGAALGDFWERQTAFFREYLLRKDN